MEKIGCVKTGTPMKLRPVTNGRWLQGGCRAKCAGHCEATLTTADTEKKRFQRDVFSSKALQNKDQRSCGAAARAKPKASSASLGSRVFIFTSRGAATEACGQR